MIGGGLVRSYQAFLPTWRLKNERPHLLLVLETHLLATWLFRFLGCFKFAVSLPKAQKGSTGLIWPEALQGLAYGRPSENPLSNLSIFQRPLNGLQGIFEICSKVFRAN